jgi:hypothetical protein
MMHAPGCGCSNCLGAIMGDYSDYTPVPIVYTSVEELNPSELGLAGVDGLAGWKVFKKIGHAFKKVGNAIKKIKISTILKVAIPLVAGGLFAGLALPAIAAKFGKKTAALVQDGRTRAVQIVRPDGSRAAVLLKTDEFAKVSKILKDPVKGAITEAALSKLLGRDVAGLIVGAVKSGAVEISVADAKPQIEEHKNIPLKAGVGIGVAALVGSALLLGSKKNRSRPRGRH